MCALLLKRSSQTSLEKSGGIWTVLLQTLGGGEEAMKGNAGELKFSMPNETWLIQYQFWFVVRRGFLIKHPSTVSPGLQNWCSHTVEQMSFGARRQQPHGAVEVHGISVLHIYMKSCIAFGGLFYCFLFPCGRCQLEGTAQALLAHHHFWSQQGISNSNIRNRAGSWGNGDTSQY